MPLIFSYGTLQQEDVQRSIFGRLLRGEKDELVGFELGRVEITNSAEAAETGRTHHANVVFDGRSDHRVSGTAFEIAEAELVQADQYELTADYRRIATTLASGNEAWVYVHRG